MSAIPQTAAHSPDVSMPDPLVFTDAAAAKLSSGSVASASSSGFPAC